MTDGADDSDLILPAQPEAASLDPYSEDDDVVTREVEALEAAPRWLVQFTALDRRLMETSELVAALLGGSIGRDTLVWRGGMDDWVAVGRLDLLAPSAIPTLPPRGRAASTRPVSHAGKASRRASGAAASVGAKPLELTLASLAIALSAAAITTSFLSVAGVFDADTRGRRVQALRVEPLEQRRLSGEGSAARVKPALPAPDAQRASAVAH